VGADAAKHQPRNLPRRRQGCGAAIILPMEWPRYTVSGELSLSVGWGAERSAPFFMRELAATAKGV